MGHRVSGSTGRAAEALGRGARRGAERKAHSAERRAYEEQEAGGSGQGAAGSWQRTEKSSGQRTRNQENSWQQAAGSERETETLWENQCRVPGAERRGATAAENCEGEEVKRSSVRPEDGASEDRGSGRSPGRW